MRGDPDVGFAAPVEVPTALMNFRGTAFVHD